MNNRIKVEKLKKLFIYLLLFLAAMNFKAKFFYFVFISFFIVLTKHKVTVDYISVIYVALGVLMAVYNYDEGILSMFRCFAPVCFYLVGLNIITYDKKVKYSIDIVEEVQNKAYILISMISWGSFSHYFLNFLYNLNRDMGRNTLDIWSGKVIAATGQNAMTCLMLGLAIATLYMPLKKTHKYIAMGCLVIMLGYNLTLASRTLIVMMVCVMIVAWIYTKKRGNLIERKKKSLNSGNVLVALIICFIVIKGNILNNLFDSILFNRLDGSIFELFNNSSRTSTKIKFFLEMWNYPFGGLHMYKKYGYAHDLLLDGYDEYGVLILFVLIPILVSGAHQLYKLIQYSSYSEKIKLPLLLMNICIWLEFTVEPILTGMPWLLSCYCLLNGCIARMNKTYLLQVIRRSNSENENIANKYSVWKG